MKVLLQRVCAARVVVDGEAVASIQRGLLIYLGVESGDGAKEADLLARRAAELRIFDDASGKMNLGLRQVGGGALVVSQFTLAADTRRGRRPSYGGAAAPELAEPLYERFADGLAEQGIHVERGVFRATMQVESTNDGPVTLMLDCTAAEIGT
jgi:D-tyrosyl-tRNA(Tyr) deacylase